MTASVVTPCKHPMRIKDSGCRWQRGNFARMLGTSGIILGVNGKTWLNYAVVYGS